MQKTMLKPFAGQIERLRRYRPKDLRGICSRKMTLPTPTSSSLPYWFSGACRCCRRGSDKSVLLPALFVCHQAPLTISGSVAFARGGPGIDLTSNDLRGGYDQIRIGSG